VGRNKAESAAAQVQGLNGDVTVAAIPHMLDRDDLDKLVATHDVVVDCVDTFGMKLAISDACRQRRRPLVWATVVSMQGQCSVFGVPDAEGNLLWLRDLHRELPPDSDLPLAKDVGVLGAVVAQVASVQATETIKLLAGLGDLLVGRVWFLDAMRARSFELPLRPGVGRVTRHGMVKAS